MSALTRRTALLGIGSLPAAFAATRASPATPDAKTTIEEVFRAAGYKDAGERLLLSDDRLMKSIDPGRLGKLKITRYRWDTSRTIYPPRTRPAL